MTQEKISSEEQLDELLESGKISGEEYDELKAAMAPKPQTTAPTKRGKRLTKSWRNRQLGGVCGGIANYFGWEKTGSDLLRIGTVILALMFPVVLLVYLVLFFVFPWDEQPGAQRSGRKWRYALIVVGLVLLNIICAVKLMPYFLELYAGLGVELPTLAKISLRFTDALRHSTIMVLFLLATAPVIIAFLLTNVSEATKKVLFRLTTASLAALFLFHVLGMVLSLTMISRLH